jgi:mRNA-decapping enzyme subunit 2
LKPEDVIELSIKEQRISLFIVPGVEEDFPFQTKTRKEISVSDTLLVRGHRFIPGQRIEWFQLADLPTWKRNKQVPGKFYLISPFIG